MDDDPSEWKVDRLKQELRDRGAKLTGRKAELLERLLSYRRNDNFAAGPNIVLPSSQSQMPSFPPSAKFHSITKSDQAALPPITRSHVEEFLAKYLVKDVNLPTSVAMDKAEKIMAENVLAASILTKSEAHSTNSGNDRKQPDEKLVFYLTGIVKASMRKNFSYHIKIAINVKTIEIIGTECECPVGVGPNAACKHILGTLLVLAHFFKTGELKVQLSCTEQLQTFKRPSKVHVGPPVKVQNLGKGAKDYDPRPERFRNMPNYPDLVRNETINYCANSNKDITMKYAYSGSSKKDIVHDHHYVGCLDQV